MITLWELKWDSRYQCNSLDHNDDSVDDDDDDDDDDGVDDDGSVDNDDDIYCRGNYRCTNTIDHQSLAVVVLFTAKQHYHNIHSITTATHHHHHHHHETTSLFSSSSSAASIRCAAAEWSVPVACSVAPCCPA